MKFNVNNKYSFDLSEKITFGSIAKDSLYEIFRDGRITGLLAEYFIESEFSNMNRVRNNNSYLDLIDDKGKKFEVKCFTARGVSFLPSNQKGQGRKFNANDYRARLLNIDYFIVVNISQLPQVKILTFFSYFIVEQNIKSIGNAKKLEELYQKYAKTNIPKKP